MQACTLWSNWTCPSCFEKLDTAPSLRFATIGSIIGRLAAPDDEHSTKQWLERTSGLGEFLGCSHERIPFRQFSQASRMLLRNRSTIEKQLFTQTIRLFDRTPTDTLYVLTSTAGKAKHGRWERPSHYSPRVTLALVVNGSGFVRTSRVFKESISEVSLLEELFSSLEVPTDARVVVNRSIASEDRIAWLKAQGYRYIVVSKGRRKRPMQANAVTTPSGSNSQLYRETFDDEVRLYCRLRIEEVRAMTEERATLFEQSLKNLSDGLSLPRTRKRLDLVQEHVERLQARYDGIGQHYEIEVHTDKGGKQAQEITWTKKTGAMKTMHNIQGLRINEMEWTDKDLWQTYLTFTRRETVSRTLLSEL